MKTKLFSILLLSVLSLALSPASAADEKEQELFDQQVKEFIQKKFPDEKKDLDNWYKQDRSVFESRLNQWRTVYIEYENLKARDPDLAKIWVEKMSLKDKAERIAQSYSDANDFEAKQKVEKRLREVATRLFEMSLEELEVEAASLQQRLFAVQEKINYRKNHADDLIERRVIEQVSQFDDAMNW